MQIVSQKTSGYFTICHNFTLELNYSPVLLSVRAFTSICFRQAGFYLGVRTCELFLCFVAIDVDFFVFFVLRHW